MKKIYSFFAATFLFACMFLSMHSNAQSPQKMSYQAVIRNANSELVTSSEIGMRISILQGSADGTAVYTETLTSTTNANGLVSIEFGGAGFDAIDWTNGPFYIKTETDPSGGTSYSIVGVSQLLSVPFALHAKTAEVFTGTIDEVDPIFGSSPAAGIENDDISSWNAAYGWGDHSGEGYLIEEVDPVFAAWDKSTGIQITESQITDLQGYLLNESDPDFNTSVASGIASEDVASWNEAYGWGDHSEENYLTTEVDPLFSAWDKSIGIQITESQITDLQDYLLTESDPDFNASVASGIASEDVTSWNEAYGWGDHSAEGYLTFEVDPVFLSWDKSTGIEITESQITDLQDYLLAESDPDFNASAASGITSENVANWNTAYGWGDHSTQGYLTSVSAESDPLFSSSPASGIENDDISSWNEAYSWGDHSAEGYLAFEADPAFLSWDKSTGIQITESQITDLQDYLLAESDPDFNASVASGIASENVTNWNEAYGWGDHSAEGYLTFEADPVFLSWDKSTGIEITENQIMDLQDYLLAESDPNFNASVASGIASDDISNWNTAYSWGDHSDEGYISSETDPEFSVWDRSTGIQITESQIADLQDYLLTENDPDFNASAASGIANTDITNWNEAYGWGDHSEGGYLTSEADPTYIATFSISDPVDGDLLRYNATSEKWEKYTPNYAAETHTHATATDEEDGFMSSTDKTKLDDLQNVNITAGTGISVTGTYPNQTIASSHTLYLGQEYLDGIIYYLYIGSDGQQHGLVVSKTETTAKWQNTSYLVNADRSEDGAYNTGLMANSPAKDWATSHGAGWYLPSIDELTLLWQNRYHVNKTSRSIGSTLLSSTAYYWSSTEYGSGGAFCFYFATGINAPVTYFTAKHVVYSVRAVKAF